MPHIIGHQKKQTRAARRMDKTNPKKRPASADFLEDTDDDDDDEEEEVSPRRCLGKMKKKSLPKKRIILEDSSDDRDEEKEKASYYGATALDQLPHDVMTKKLLAFLKTQDLCALAKTKNTTLKRTVCEHVHEDRKKLHRCQVCFETRIFPKTTSRNFEAKAVVSAIACQQCARTVCPDCYHQDDYDDETENKETVDHNKKCRECDAVIDVAGLCQATCKECVDACPNCQQWLCSDCIRNSGLVAKNSYDAAVICEHCSVKGCVHCCTKCHGCTTYLCRGCLFDDECEYNEAYCLDCGGFSCATCFKEEEDWCHHCQ